MTATPKLEARLLRNTLLGSSLIILALFVASMFGGFRNFVRVSVERPLEFSARSGLFNNSVPLDPRIKVLVFDDQLTGALQRPQLKATEWAALIRSINRSGPKAIIIDQIFAFESAAEGSSAEFAEFVEAVKSAGNVYAGAMLTRYQTPGRNLVPTSKLQRSAVGAGVDASSQVSLNAYGPTDRLAEALAGIGHISYRADGMVDTQVDVRAGYQIGHLMLSPLTNDAPPSKEIPINFIDESTFTASLRSLAPFVKIATEGGKPTSIGAEDFVVIVPHFYTGNSDVDHSPIGRIYRSHAWVSVLNSFLSKRFITDYSSWAPAVTVIAGVGGTLAGLWFTGPVFWLVASLQAVLVTFIGLFAFSSFSMTLPWMFPLVTGLFSSIVAFATRSRFAEQKVEILKKTLKGTVPERQLNKYLENPGLVTMDSSEQILTLMFVDIAGFSQIAERSSPRAMFERLQEILGTLTKIVHKHGGSVDKTLGDGLLCFFGYSLDGKTAVSNQADAAISCAIEMQSACLEWNLLNINQQKPVFPIRIGINTANVFVGYLGNEDRYDFTIIGNGVNFAQRLESACEPMSLLMSSTTLDFSSNYTQSSSGIKTKRIKIKHHSELFSAVEIDPLVDRSEQRAVVVEVFRKQQNLDRKEQRWPVEDFRLIDVQTNYGAAKLRDFSVSGGCIDLPMYLARGVQMELTMNSQDGELSARLLAKGIETILVEVCWSRPSDQGFVHGFRHLNLNRQQNQFIFRTLREILPSQRYKSSSIVKIS